MKKIFLLLPIVLFIYFSSCTNAPKSDEAKTTEAKEVSNEAIGETWKVDPNASKIKWIGTKVTGYHIGEVPIKSGEIKMEQGNVVSGKTVMNLAGMTVVGPKGSDAASNTKLQGHLKSSDFFDVEKYPEASFEITGVEPFSGTVEDSADSRQEEISEYKVTNPTHTISGNLTIKGITKNISFPAKITVEENKAEAMAKFNIDRREWNITYPGKPDDLIRNSIHFGILLKVNK